MRPVSLHQQVHILLGLVLDALLVFLCDVHDVGLLLLLVLKLLRQVGVLHFELFEQDVHHGYRFEVVLLLLDVGSGSWMVLMHGFDLLQVLGCLLEALEWVLLLCLLLIVDRFELVDMHVHRLYEQSSAARWLEGFESDEHLEGLRVFLHDFGVLDAPVEDQ